MLSMFKEKDSEKGAAHWSMTRVVAFLAAITLNYALIIMANKDHVHDIAWPFCLMYIVTLLAVPVQALFKMIQVYLTTSPGQTLLKSALKKVQESGVAVAAPLAAIVETQITTGGATTDAEKG
jgi:hypothetical protein